MILPTQMGFIVPGGDATITTNFLARTSGLDATHTNAYKALINGLVTDAICTDTTWGPFDLIGILATQDSTTALLNLPNASFNFTLINSPSFSADNGYTGNGTNSYIDTNFNPATAGGNYVQNDAHYSIWNLTNQQTTGAQMGNFATGKNSAIFCRFTDDKCYNRINSLTGPAGVTNTDARGWYSASRTSSSNIEFYKNGSSIASQSDTSAALASNNIYVCGQDVAGAFTGVTNQIAAFSVGKSLTATQTLNFYNRLRTYMTTVGVP